jgi:hypothetical protein
MVTFPEDGLVIKDIHASYVDPSKLVSHYRQQVGSGCVHFRAANAEGILFFDRNGIVASHYHDSDQTLEDQAANEWLMQSASVADLRIDVYAIASDRLPFWSRLPSATAIYSNLSTEFTDLMKLLKKMTAEELTGYIDVDLGKNGETGRIFLIDGKFIGGTYSDTGNRLLPGKSDLENLIRKTSQAQGVFNVYSIAMPKATSDAAETQAAEQSEALQMLAELIAHTEKLVIRAKAGKGDFQTNLKKQFMQRIDQFAFLDPFTAEFQYRNGTVSFTGEADEARLASGIIATLFGLADELGIRHLFIEALGDWHKRHADRLVRWGIPDAFETD